jgi:hypothetical protein
MIWSNRWGGRVEPSQSRPSQSPNCRPPTVKTAITRPTYRRGWVLAAVREALAAASGTMQTQAIHAAVERAGESIASSSVRSCLVESLGGKTPRFERVGRGRFRLAPRFERVE